jgi:hypothetical protein
MVLRLLALVSLLFLSQASLARQLETKTPDDVPDTCPVARPLAACGASLDSRNEKDYVIHRNRL